ncbi:MAG: asparaginase domain-containing protein, partial [Breznakiellaceae bacterium]
MFQEAYSYDDVLLVPGYSEVLPRECDVRTRLCADITLNVPIMSAAMDTVTEERLAIAIALEGGTGVIHRNLKPEVQAQQVANVDSKDMDRAVWQALLRAVQDALDDADVGAVVVTHGTDTMEETAWLLQAVLAPTKPVVLTGAMRPASAAVPDGPQNLTDALALATDTQALAAGGVWVTL